MNYDILRDLISFNTIEDKDNMLIMDYCINFLKEYDFSIKEIIKDNKKAIIATRGDAKIGFLGHTDVVKVNDEWLTNPFELTIKDDKLIGRGTCDMKGGVAAFLEAIKEIDKSIPLQVVLTYDEEIDFGGIEEITKYKDLLVNTFIVGEPTNNIPVLATKGIMEYKLEMYGVPVHSSLKPKGISAIDEMIKFINDLNKIIEKLQKEENNLFEVPTLTSNIGLIKGGSAVNIVPDYCEINFDFRTINSNQNIIINKELNELIKKYNCKLIKGCDLSPLDENKEFSKEISSLLNKKSIGFTGVTEASFIKDKNVIILGPGPLTMHETNEYVTINSFNETIEQYKKIIKNYN